MEKCAASFWAYCLEHWLKRVAYSFTWPPSGGDDTVGSSASSTCRAAACAFELTGQFSALWLSLPQTGQRLLSWHCCCSSGFRWLPFSGLHSLVCASIQVL